MKATMWKVWCVFPNWWWASANNTDLAIRTQWQQQRWSSTWWLLLTRRKQTKRQTAVGRTDPVTERARFNSMFVRIPSYIHVCILQLSLYIFVCRQRIPSVCLSDSVFLFVFQSDVCYVGWLDSWLVHWLLFVAWLLPANVVVIVWLFFCDSSCRV